MFGNDPDSLVTTARFGFEAVFGRAGGVDALRKEGLGGHGHEGSKTSIGLKQSTKAKRSDGRW